MAAPWHTEVWIQSCWVYSGAALHLQTNQTTMQRTALEQSRHKPSPAAQPCPPWPGCHSGDEEHPAQDTALHQSSSTCAPELGCHITLCSSPWVSQTHGTHHGTHQPWNTPTAPAATAPHQPLPGLSRAARASRTRPFPSPFPPSPSHAPPCAAGFGSLCTRCDALSMSLCAQRLPNSQLASKTIVPGGDWQSNGRMNQKLLHKHMLNQGFTALFVFPTQPVSYQILRSQKYYWKTERPSPESHCQYIFYWNYVKEHPLLVRAVPGQHRDGAGTWCLTPQQAKRPNWLGQINNSEKIMMFLQSLFMLMKKCWTIDSPFQGRQLLTQLLLQILGDVSSGYLAKLETSKVIA